MRRLIDTCLVISLVMVCLFSFGWVIKHDKSMQEGIRKYVQVEYRSIR